MELYRQRYLCMALTRESNPCKNRGYYSVSTDTGTALVCYVHHKMVLRGENVIIYRVRKPRTVNVAASPAGPTKKGRKLIAEARKNLHKSRPNSSN